MAKAKIFLIYYIFSVSVLAFSVKADNRNNVSFKSEGVVIETRMLELFTKLENNTFFDIELISSDVSMVEVEADKNIASNIVTTVKKGKLKISSKGYNSGANICKIRVYAPMLDFVENKSLGKIYSDSFSAKYLKLENKSLGSIAMNLVAENADAVNKAQGFLAVGGSVTNFKLENKSMGNVEVNITTQNGDFENNGMGNISINGYINVLKLTNRGMGKIVSNVESDNTNIANDGIGSISAAGKTTLLNIDNQGIGTIDAASLNSKNAYVSNSGVGSVRVTASGEVHILKQKFSSIWIQGTENVIRY